MINERAPLIRKISHYDRFYLHPSPNPNPPAAMDWVHTGDSSPTLCVQPQYVQQQKDWGFPLAPPPSSSPSSSTSAPVFLPAALSEAQEGFRVRYKVAVAAGVMRDHNRTKVVVRHLPPSLPESTLMEQITSCFGGTFNMVSFWPGKSSTKSCTYSRAYIDFKHPEDVIEFCHGFNSHVFVNEKGTQYRALVEYAPYQRVPKLWVKKDPREGSILQDPEYLKFTELIAKPIEFLPSAETQLERREAEKNSNQAAGTKDAIIITPLMHHVRQLRATKPMLQKLLTASGKFSVRGGGSSPSSLNKVALKRYSSGQRPKEKATYVPRYDENQRYDVLTDKKSRILIELKDEKGAQDTVLNKKVSINQDIDKNGINMKGLVTAGRKIIGSDKEESANGAGSLSDSKSGSYAMRNHGPVSMKGSLPGDDSLLSKPSPRGEGASRLNRGASSSRSPFLPRKSDQLSDRDKRISRSQVWKSSSRELNGTELEFHPTEEKIERPRQDARRVRNKDRPDRPVWTVRQRGDAVESPKTSVLGLSVSPPGSQRQGRASRDFDMPDATKPVGKRVGGSSTVYGGQEKQVWVAKSGSGS